MFVPHASEILTKSYGLNNTKFWALDKKTKQNKTEFFLKKSTPNTFLKNNICTLQ